MILEFLNCYYLIKVKNIVNINIAFFLFFIEMDAIIIKGKEDYHVAARKT